jgi:hypothetical protein
MQNLVLLIGTFSVSSDLYGYNKINLFPFSFIMSFLHSHQSICGNYLRRIISSVFVADLVAKSNPKGMIGIGGKDE